MIISPLRILKTKDKYFILNLNNFRNTHYQTLNKAKINYKAVMYDQIIKLPCYERVTIDYKLYPKSKRRTDIGNVISIHQKFFEDALVELGRIEDDDYTHIISSTQSFGEVDKYNPRVEITIIAQ